MDEQGRLPIEYELRRRLSGLGQDGRRILLRTLIAPNDERATRIGAFYADPRTRFVAELLIDLEEDLGARAIVITELKSMDRDDFY